MSEDGTRKLSKAELGQRQQAALVHGARSPNQIKARARAHRRRFLRRARLKASDLDVVAAELLAHWARGVAQLDLREAGGADVAKDYWVAYNGTRRTFEKLVARLRELGLDRGPAAEGLDAYIAARYGSGAE